MRVVRQPGVRDLKSEQCFACKGLQECLEKPEAVEACREKDRFEAWDLE